MRRFPEPDFSRRAAKSQRRSLWPHREFCHASLPLYMMPLCEYENDAEDCRCYNEFSPWLRAFV